MALRYCDQGLDFSEMWSVDWITEYPKLIGFLT